MSIQIVINASKDWKVLNLSQMFQVLIKLLTTLRYENLQESKIKEMITKVK
jgi:hypothetical protein